MSTPVPARPDALNGSPDAARARLFPRLAAEGFGSLFLAVAGLGVPLFSIPQSNPLPAALAAGLAVTAAMLAFGHVSGGHFNPAITLGHLLAGRIRAGAAAAYVAAQLAGALLGALALYAVLRTLPGIADSRTAFDTVTAGFGEHSIVQAPLAAVLLLEVLGAAIIVSVFLGAAARGRANGAAAPVAVGLTFAALLQLGQAVGNLPFNPARAAASAFFSSGWAMEQLWVFLAAPLAGAAIAGLVCRTFRSLDPAGEGAVAAPQADAEPKEPGGSDVSDDEGHAAPLAAPAGQTAVSRRDSDGGASEAQEFFEGKRG